MDTPKLWKSYQRTRSIKLRNKLVVHYMPLASRQAGHMRRQFPDLITFEDLESASYFGLIKAVESYDSTKKATFETYSLLRIRGSILDWLRLIDYQTRNIRVFERQRSDAVEKLLHNESASYEDLASALNISVDRLMFLDRVSHRSFQMSCMCMDYDNDKPFEVGDPFSDDPSSTISTKMFEEFIVSQLADRERIIIELYYFRHLTLREIGKKINLTETGVGQIRVKAEHRLRRRLRRALHNQESLA